MPEQIAKARGRRADVGVRVVAVDAPGLQGAIHDEVVTRPSDVIHNFFAAALLKRLANAGAERFQHLVPRSTLPVSTSSRAGALHGIEDAIGIMNLIDGCRALGAEASAAGGVLGIAFELGDLPGFFVDVSQHSASGFAIEA